MPATLKDFTLVSDDFILCRDSGSADSTSGCVFWTETRDTAMTSDNLRLFEVVKLPHGNERHEWNGFEVRTGDMVVSIATGTKLQFPDAEGVFRLFDMEYIVAKIPR